MLDSLLGEMVDSLLGEMLDSFDKGLILHAFFIRNLAQGLVLKDPYF